MKNKTKNEIAIAFKNLLLEKSIEDITISDITDVCKINRQSFYYHFSDIYDLLEWMLSNKIKADIINNNFGAMDFEEKIRKIIDETISIRNILVNSYDEKNHILYEQILGRQISPILLAKVKDDPASKHVTEDDINFVVRCYTRILTGILIDWVSIGAPTYDLIKSENILKIIDSNIIHNTLQRFISK